MRSVLQAGFHNRQPLRGLEKATIRQKFSNHTVALLDYHIGRRSEYLLPPENTPVHLRWGGGPTGVESYYGYVNHYETTTDEHDRAFTRMVTVGTSKQMNSTNTSSWYETTRSNIARDIAARHRLRSMVHDHPYVVDNWATGTRTDFQCLKALAEESGYRLWVDGSTLWLLDPDRWVRTANSMTTPVIPRRDVFSVQVMGGSNIPGEMAAASRRVQFGLDYRTNEFFEATSGDAGQPTQVMPETVNAYSEAQEIADAVDRKQRDYYVLKSQVRGSSRVHPGYLLQLESGRVNTDQAGLWLVSEASHEITQDNFTTRVVATRGVNQTPMMRVTDTVRGTGVTHAVVRDGLTWEAALQERVHA